MDYFNFEYAIFFGENGFYLWGRIRRKLVAGRVYGPILTLNGHNFYDTQNVKEKWFLRSVVLLQYWQLVHIFAIKSFSEPIDNCFILHIFSYFLFKKSMFSSSRMMSSVLHFVMGDFLHEKVVTQRELNIKAGFPLRTLHFVQKKRIMRLFLHCCVTSDGRIRFGQGQNWQKVRTLIFPATFVLMKGEIILEILCEIYPFLDHRYILCPHRPISLYFLHQDNCCQTTSTHLALSGNHLLQTSKRWHRIVVGAFDIFANQSVIMLQMAFLVDWNASPLLWNKLPW